MRIRVYVEGGGDTRPLKTKCRQGFSEFFRKAGLEGRMPRIVASGSRNEAFDDFCIALKNASVGDFIVLLVDSEAAVAHGTGPWAHLEHESRDNWEKPPAATDDNVHLMVQCMEAWFMADKDTLGAFFGNGFNRHALPARSDIENIPKDDIYRGLQRATHLCVPKGAYGKGRHAFDILLRLDPTKVIAASPHAKRLVNTLLEKTQVGL